MTWTVPGTSRAARKSLTAGAPASWRSSSASGRWARAASTSRRLLAMIRSRIVLLIAISRVRCPEYCVLCTEYGILPPPARIHETGRPVGAAHLAPVCGLLHGAVGAGAVVPAAGLPPLGAAPAAAARRALVRGRDPGPVRAVQAVRAGGRDGRPEGARLLLLVLRPRL